MKDDDSTARKCERCQGAGMRAAEMREFEFEGYSLRCLNFVANCTVCGHRWVDPLYQEENLRLVEQARQAAIRRSLTRADFQQQDLDVSHGEELAQYRQNDAQGAN